MKRRVLKKVITARGEEILCDITPNLSRQNSGDLDLRTMEGRGAQVDQPPTSTNSPNISKTNSSTQRKSSIEQSRSLTADSFRPSPQIKTPHFLGSAFVATVLAASAAADGTKQSENAGGCLDQILSDEPENLKPPVSLDAERHLQSDREPCSPEIIISFDESERRSSPLGSDLSHLNGGTSADNKQVISSYIEDDFGSIASTVSNSPSRSERSESVNRLVELQMPKKISGNTIKSATAEEANANDLGLMSGKDVPCRWTITDQISTPVAGVLRGDGLETRISSSSYTSPLRKEPTSTLSPAEDVDGSKVMEPDSHNVPLSSHVPSTHQNMNHKTSPVDSGQSSPRMSGNNLNCPENRNIQSTEKINQLFVDTLNTMKHTHEDKEVLALGRPRLSVRHHSLPDAERVSMPVVSGSSVRSSSFDVSSLTTEHTITWSQHKRFSEEPQCGQGALQQTTRRECLELGCGPHCFSFLGDVSAGSPMLQTKDSVHAKAFVKFHDRSNVQEKQDSFNTGGTQLAGKTAEERIIHEIESITQNFERQQELSAFRSCCCCSSSSFSCSRSRSRSPLYRWEPVDQSGLKNKTVDDQWRGTLLGAGDNLKDTDVGGGVNLGNGSGETLLEVTAETRLKGKLDADLTSLTSRLDDNCGSNDSGSGITESKVPSSGIGALKNNNPDGNNAQRKPTSLPYPDADLNSPHYSQSKTSHKICQCHTNQQFECSHTSDSELSERRSKDAKRVTENGLMPIGGRTDNKTGELAHGGGRANRSQSEAGQVRDHKTSFNPCSGTGQNCDDSTVKRCSRMSKLLQCGEPSLKRATRAVSVSAVPHGDLTSIASPSMTRDPGGGQSARVNVIPYDENVFSDYDIVYVQRRRRPVYKLDTSDDQCPEQVKGNCCKSQDEYHWQLSSGNASQEIDPYNSDRACSGQQSRDQKYRRSGAVDPELHWNPDTVALALTQVSGNLIDEQRPRDYDDVSDRAKGKTATGDNSLSSSRTNHSHSGVESQHAIFHNDSHHDSISLCVNNQSAELASPISSAIGRSGFRDSATSPNRQSQCCERVLTPTQFRSTQKRCSYPTEVKESSDCHFNQMSGQILKQSNSPSGYLDWSNVRKPENQFVPISTEDLFDVNVGIKNSESISVSRENSLEKEDRSSGEAVSVRDPSTTDRFLTPTRFREDGRGQSSGQSSGDEEFEWTTDHCRDHGQGHKGGGQVEVRLAQPHWTPGHHNESTAGLWSSVRQETFRNLEVPRYKNEPAHGNYNVTSEYGNLHMNTIHPPEGQIDRHPPFNTHHHDSVDECCYHPNGDIHQLNGLEREEISGPRQSYREDCRHLAEGDYFRHSDSNKNYKPITNNIEHFSQVDASWLGCGEMNQPLNSSRFNTTPLGFHFDHADSLKSTGYFPPSVRGSGREVLQAGILKVSSNSYQQKDSRIYPLDMLNPHLSDNSEKIPTKTTDHDAIAPSRAFISAGSNNACELDSQSVVGSPYKERKEEYTNMEANIMKILHEGSGKPHKCPTQKNSDCDHQLKPNSGIPIRRKRSESWSQPATPSRHHCEVLGISSLRPWKLSPYALSNMSSSHTQRSNPGPDLDTLVNKSSDSHQNPSLYPPKNKHLQRVSQSHGLYFPEVSSRTTQSHPAWQHSNIHRNYSSEALDHKINHPADTIDRQTNRPLVYRNPQTGQISAICFAPVEASQSWPHCLSAEVDSSSSSARPGHSTKETDQDGWGANMQPPFPTHAHPTNLKQTAVHPNLRQKIPMTSQLNHQQTPTFEGRCKPIFPYSDPEYDLKTRLTSYLSPTEQARSHISPDISPFTNSRENYPWGKEMPHYPSTQEIPHYPSCQDMPHYPIVQEMPHCTCCEKMVYITSNEQMPHYLSSQDKPVYICSSNLSSQDKPVYICSSNLSSQDKPVYSRSSDMLYYPSSQEKTHYPSPRDMSDYPSQHMSRHQSQFSHTQEPQFREPWSRYRDSQVHPRSGPYLSAWGQQEHVQPPRGHCRDPGSVRLLRQSTVDTLDSGITEESSQHWG